MLEVNQYSESFLKEKEKGNIPEWYTLQAFQFFNNKYMNPEEGSVRERFKTIARTAASHLSNTKYEKEAESKFFDLLWKGWLSPSTPVLSNMGTNKGFSVSCSGSVVDDSIHGFYSNRLETAMLTKFGFGTSGYLGNIRPRGSKISRGGTASGVLPVFKGHVQDMRDVAQGTSRRGAWAGYIEIDHGDFDELVDYILNEPDDANIGWIIKDSFIERLNNLDAEAIRRYQRAMKLKMVTGRGYFCFIDKINRNRPEAYVKNELYVKGSNLCNEITLFSDQDHTFTCVLSSMNVYRYDEWKNTDAVYWATIFLDCVAQDFISKARDIPGLEKAVRFTEKGRALGLGQCGFHTLLQKKMIPMESLEAHFLSQEIAKYIYEEAKKASKDMAVELGEPEWCKGLGVRNTHLIAIAPTKSTSILMGNMSEGINPDPAMLYTQNTAGGEIKRINIQLEDYMRKNGLYTEENISEIIDNFGSVQNVSWLGEEEKKVFKTAFEINQTVLLRLASSRKIFIDQWQSLNLFFAGDTDPSYISDVHNLAFNNSNILGLYYIYSSSSVTGAKSRFSVKECEVCQ